MSSIKYAFRIVHIDNIPHILRHGITLPTSAHANPRYVPIGDANVIAKRKGRMIGGKSIGDYIPFYFGPRSPMLYIVQKGSSTVRQQRAEDIVYCAVSIETVISENLKGFFTDGHALSRMTQIHKIGKLKDIDQYVDYSDVYSTCWGYADDTDLKRRKEAELLLADDLPPEMIAGYVVCNEQVRQRLIEMGINEQKVAVRAAYYY